MDESRLLEEFRKSFERLANVRASAEGVEGESAVRHAEMNFYATAESLGRLLQKISQAA